MGELKALHIMCKQDTERVKVAPESVLSNRGNLKGTHLIRFSPGGGYLRGVISVHQAIQCHAKNLMGFNYLQ